MKKNNILACLILSVVSTATLAQSRRVEPQKTSVPAAATDAAQKSAAELYKEAAEYAQKRYADFAAKKTPFSQVLEARVKREQQQLAERYAGQIVLRNASNNDFYYAGALYVLAGNYEKAFEQMSKFIAAPSADTDKVQSARVIVVVSSARRKSFDEAEKFLAEYEKTEPRSARELMTMQAELAAAYQDAGNFERAAFHAENAYKALKPALVPNLITSDLYNINTALTVRLLQIYAAQKNAEKFLPFSEDAAKNAVKLQMTTLYNEVIERRAYFLIENKRKAEALNELKQARENLNVNFRGEDARRYVASMMSRFERQLTLIGETAPEITVDKWLTPTTMNLSQLRGKVILLDFWATWCAPCIESFPKLSEWQEIYGDKGLVIIGLTRYYGTVEAGEEATPAAELNYLKKFRAEKQMNYHVAVTKDKTTQDKYGANSLPTAVLIDRQGKIRFSKIGSSEDNEQQLERKINELLAEQ